MRPLPSGQVSGPLIVVAVASGKVVNAGPCRDITRQRAVVVAAGVIDSPAQPGRIEVPPDRANGPSTARLRASSCTTTGRHRQLEAAAGRELAHPILEARHLVTVAPRWTHGGLETFLPPAVDEQALARRVHQVPLVEAMAVEQAEILEQFPHQAERAPRHRHVVRAPWECAHLVAGPIGRCHRPRLPSRGA